MMTSGKTRSKSPVLLAAFLGLAATASGCIIDGSSDGGPRGGSCFPDLTVYWRVTDIINGSETPITCAQAGAGSVQGLVGGIEDQVLCPPGNSTGDPLFFPLDRTGWYDVHVRLLDTSGTVELSGTNPDNPPEIFVDCSGLTTPPVELFLCVGPNCPIASQLALKGQLALKKK